MNATNAIETAADLVSVAATAGALRTGAPLGLAEGIGAALGAILKAVLTNHDPGALARDLAAEAAHRNSTRAVIQAALDAAGGRHE